jgi:hypothetical protein
MGRSTRVVVAGLAGALCMASPAAAVTETAASGVTEATLEFSEGIDGPPPELQIRRAGVLLVDTELDPVCDGCLVMTPTFRGSPLSVRDVDGDGEPEVTVDQYTGGAHCCAYMWIFDFVAAESRYEPVMHFFGNGSYARRDFGGDGLLEWRAADDRFAYKFASYAESYRPIRIWRFVEGRFVDVTREHRRQIRRDATRAWRIYRRVRRGTGDVRGVLAAYMADKYMLGEAPSGWRRLRSAARGGWIDRPEPYGTGPEGFAYLKKLRRFLIRTGYAR